MFQQSTTETPWTQETGGTIKVVRNKVQQLEIDIKIEAFYIPQVFAQCMGASAAVPPVHSHHCQHTADPPAPDGELIIKENRKNKLVLTHIKKDKVVRKKILLRPRVITLNQILIYKEYWEARYKFNNYPIEDKDSPNQVKIEKREYEKG